MNLEIVQLNHFVYWLDHFVVIDCLVDFVVIDPDHHMEAIAKDKMVSLIKKWQQENHWEIKDVFSSTINTDPYTYI